MPNSRTILLFGNFDLLHPGHLNLFRQAKRHGQRLIVVVSRDAVAKQVRGHSLAQSETVRLAAVKASPYVYQARLGDRTPNHNFHLVKLIKPDVLCLGYDQKWKIPTIRKRLKSVGLLPQIIRLKPYHPEKFKSSLMRKLQTKNQKLRGRIKR
ncbi:MAG: adenylyltransferase/cytidyltransferase family protein [Candidatus Kerfeldbacteria bacterium]|nr:adenylyltransferase/cytidyltransferase family protein [Candidatus Kerfeldbacteria bacterium]